MVVPPKKEFCSAATGIKLSQTRRLSQQRKGRAVCAADALIEKRLALETKREIPLYQAAMCGEKS